MHEMIGELEDSAPVRMVIADDDGVFLESLRALIEAQPELQIVGTARDGLEAIELTAALEPDAVVIGEPLGQTLRGGREDEHATEAAPGGRRLRRARQATFGPSRFGSDGRALQTTERDHDLTAVPPRNVAE